MNKRQIRVKALEIAGLWIFSNLETGADLSGWANGSDDDEWKLAAALTQIADGLLDRSKRISAALQAARR